MGERHSTDGYLFHTGFHKITRWRTPHRFTIASACSITSPSRWYQPESVSSSSFFSKIRRCCTNELAPSIVNRGSTYGYPGGFLPVFSLQRFPKQVDALAGFLREVFQYRGREASGSSPAKSGQRREIQLAPRASRWSVSNSIQQGDYLGGGKRLVQETRETSLQIMLMLLGDTGG